MNAKNDNPSAGHNVPALSHEGYAKQAVSSLRAGDKQAIKGSHNVIEALLIAHQNGVLDGQPIASIPELHAMRGREFNLNPIMAEIFGTRSKGEDGIYRVVGGTAELAREYEDAPIPAARRVKAEENDRLDKALRTQIIRNLTAVALLAEAGGAWHHDERPLGVAAIDDKLGLLQIRASVWYAEARKAWEERAGGPMSREQADAWVLLDGTRQWDGAHTLTTLQAKAARHYGKVRAGRPRGARTQRNTMPEAIAYIHTVIGEGDVGKEEQEQLAELLPDLLRVLCARNGDLDLERVQRFWEEEDPKRAVRAA